MAEFLELYFLRPTGSSQPKSPGMGNCSLCLLACRGIIDRGLLMLFIYCSLLTHNIKLIAMIRTLTTSRKILSFGVANVSKKEARYSFESAWVQKIHPVRKLSQGTDRILVTPHLLVMADHGAQTLKKDSANLDDIFTKKLLSILKLFFEAETNRYCQNIYKLVESAVEHTKEEGSCTLAVAAMHPETGEVSCYYLGDSLYGIFRKDKVEMVERLYQNFHNAKRLGNDCQYHPSAGFTEQYFKEDISKDDIIVLGSNGLWDNVNLDILHYELRGPGSFLPNKSKYPDSVGQIIKEIRPLPEMAERIGKVAEFCARKGKYESPVYLQAKAAGVQFPMEGFLDDVSVILARRKKETVISQGSR